MSIFKKGNGESSESLELRNTVLRAGMPAPVEKIALKESEKISKLNPAAAEYTIGINYIEYLVSLPWNQMTEDNLDIARAERVLDEAHCGLLKVKNRILEHLAVRILKSSERHRILVVDDEERTRLNLAYVFEKDGYLVHSAANGADAVALIRENIFDVIVTDLKMEKVDGMRVLEDAKLKNPNTEVIIITGYATVPRAIEAMQKGSYHFLTKPLNLAEIRSTIKRALFKKNLRLTSQGPILCFAGPPGTGKTSLGKSIARGLERKFIRISLAGIRDEAEIRGHRRSYVGALPGRIIQEIRRGESRNPVFVLDEIDKLGHEFKGDPAAALLEVLDPEQNAHFMDHYLDVPFDLSRVMFIATANTVHPIPEPLLDRLEVISLSGYTEEEKLCIAEKYLIPAVLEDSGLSDHPPVFTPDAVRKIIREYTREAGVRSLKRQIASVCRKKARQRLSAEGKYLPETIGPETIEHQLGPKKYYLEVAQTQGKIGVAAGLAWTEAGGELIFIESTRMKGKNRLILTGSLGEVMKESAQAALSYIRSHTEAFRIDEDFFDSHDIHIHVPAGAIAKDGPSAGLPIAVALLSLLTGKPCRMDTALSGEMTLSGRILQVGGVKEKVLAAHRAGVSCVVFPAKNEADLGEIPQEVKRALKIMMINEIDEVVQAVFS